jgi:hypothetical protein
MYGGIYYIFLNTIGRTEFNMPRLKLLLQIKENVHPKMYTTQLTIKLTREQ